MPPTYFLPLSVHLEKFPSTVAPVRPGDAAGIAAVFVRDGAGRRLTRSQIAEVHAADNAADIAALAGHIAGVDALLDDGLVFILLAVDVRKVARDIVLGVKRVFDGHGTGDAARC